MLKKDKEHTMEGWGLLVEGLESFSVLTRNSNHSQIEIESFVSGLNALPSLFRQIVIVSKSRYLSP